MRLASNWHAISFGGCSKVPSICAYFDMSDYDRTTKYIFIKYIVVSFFLFLVTRLISRAFFDGGYFDLIAVFIFSLMMAFAINEAYKKGGADCSICALLRGS